MKFEAIIGLEIHVEMTTKSKMFSDAPVTYGYEPNTAVSPIDVAFPGTMPTVNEQAIINAIIVSNALHMTIDRELWFDRKNYFYPDLPKGYQITQNDRPIGKDGHVDIVANGEHHRISINRLHIEEDTAMQHHYDDDTLIDYNRAGIPLMEIVTNPDLRNGAQATSFVEKIRSIVTFSNVSSGKMEEGSLRCDVNISLRKHGEKVFGTKVEIKNLNSISNVGKAIDYEIDRQTQLLIKGASIAQETRRYDEDLKQTIAMRLKTDTVDYKYFTEPNIVPIKLSEQFIDDAIKNAPELADVKYTRYTEQLQLGVYDAKLIISDKDVSFYFDEVILTGANCKLVANWINGDVASYLNKNNMNIKLFPIKPIRLGELILLIEKGTISNNQAREIFEKMLSEDTHPLDIAKRFNIMQQSDETIIVQYIEAVLKEFPQSVFDYQQGKDRALGFLVGQVMKKSKGKANPSLTSKLIIKKINKK
jgi:aspartyl-tRNA(Asn)/glutamyl-tRNA(Gln) amidotransferase subunit B